jgi:hypothetical protein
MARARDGLRALSVHAQRMETKAFLMNSATERDLDFVYNRSFEKRI